MAGYNLRVIDDSLWGLFKNRCAAEGHSVRYVLLKLIEQYVRIGLTRIVP